MKKTLLTLLCSVGTILAAQANTLTVVNLTGCSCAFSFRGYGDPALPGTYYESPNTTVPPGNTFYAAPSAIPGMGSLPATAVFTYIKGGVLTTVPGVGLACGSVASGVGTSMTTTATSIPCNNNSSVTASWQQNAAGNVVVLIM
ncbi:hypothetical protein [Taibaiella chishuiensis]|uniref:Ig-like domain-containing protein n=1 Tax=Taibaiella chishuiensis TaxID=1434707 RepID=A0A2P8D0J8_9BACT|nr:hypothetical protein [Taibaiella chishuiensis]PSK90738.1 hypothetical protein B0I18_107148 [Taibaiella chishuiensis]